MSGCSSLEVGIASQTMAGRPDSGDRHVLCPFPGGVLVGVLDGLGHGSEAFEAARLAAATLEEHARDPLASLMARCHARLLTARGVVMSLASFRHEAASMTWAGIGNVEGILVRGSASSLPRREFLLLRPGVVGARVPSIEPRVLAVGPGDTLVFATDGVRGDFLDLVARDIPCHRIANRILTRHGRGDDDALVCVARYLGNGR